ncbi:MAG: hypothetical protein LW820_06745 [Acidibacter sp.]|jgi:hypothetical protein|nr:hypothetical protein [Acidibacter sp.]
MTAGRAFTRAVEPKRYRGQAMLEYSLLCAVLLLALVAPWSGNPSPAQQLLDAIVHRIHVFIWWLAVI